MHDAEVDAGPHGLDLKQALSVVWRGKGVIAATALACATVALAYALTADEVYRSEALVQPRQETRTGAGLLSLSGAIGGIGDVAGFSTVSGERAVAVATLKSRVLIETFIDEKKLLPKLYASKWDAETGKWTVAPDKVPTTWQAYNDFTKRVLKIVEDRKTGLVTVGVEWRDPEEARDWVSELIARTNAHLKSQAIEEGERNLSYLETQSRKIGQIELQQALYGLVESELKKLMIAKGRDEFALKTIDKAVVPKRRTWPKRMLICVVGFGLGGIAGVLLVLARNAWKA